MAWCGSEFSKRPIHVILLAEVCSKYATLLRNIASSHATDMIWSERTVRGAAVRSGLMLAAGASRVLMFAVGPFSDVSAWTVYSCFGQLRLVSWRRQRYGCVSAFFLRLRGDVAVGSRGIYCVACTHRHYALIVSSERRQLVSHWGCGSGLWTEVLWISSSAVETGGAHRPFWPACALHSWSKLVCVHLSNGRCRSLVLVFYGGGCGRRGAVGYGGRQRAHPGVGAGLVASPPPGAATEAFAMRSLAKHRAGGAAVKAHSRPPSSVAVFGGGMVTQPIGVAAAPVAAAKAAGLSCWAVDAAAATAAQCRSALTVAPGVVLPPASTRGR